ncbi:MAG: hypothetical protein Q7R86_03145 [bacterium]|nr:hypothetical protein [bacterium]
MGIEVPPTEADNNMQETNIASPKPENVGMQPETLPVPETPEKKIIKDRHRKWVSETAGSVGKKISSLALAPGALVSFVAESAMTKSRGDDPGIVKAMWSAIEHLVSF